MWRERCWTSRRSFGRISSRAPINEAEYRQLASRLSLEALVARYPGRKGTVALRAIVDARLIGRTRTRSELEAAFLAVLDAHGLPRPAINCLIELPSGWIEGDA